MSRRLRILFTPAVWVMVLSAGTTVFLVALAWQGVH